MKLFEKARIVEVLPTRSGDGKNGTWYRTDVRVEEMDVDYPNSCVMTLWKSAEEAAAMGVTTGAVGQVFASIGMRLAEGGKWYNDMRMLRFNAG